MMKETCQLSKFVFNELPNYLSAEEFEECHGRKPELVELDIDPTESLHADELSQGLFYADSSLDFMSPVDRSEEAYFGDNNPYKIGMIGLIHELRTKYDEVMNSNKKSEKKELADQLYPIIDKISAFIEKSFNIEKCYFGLFEECNANSLPLCWDSSLVTIEKNGKKVPKRLVNREVKASLEDIMETKTGYKYKDKKGKIYVINFGLGFFNGQYTDEECVAIITHELGHAMQQAMCSINQNLAMVYINYLFDEIHEALNPFMMLGSFGTSALIAIFDGIEFSKAKKADPEELGDDVIIYNIGANRKEYDRDRWGQDAEETTDKTIRDISKNKKKHGFFAFIGRFISKLIIGAFVMIHDLLFPIFNLVDIPGNIFQLSNMGFLKKNRKFEQFADMFCSVYGLGPAQASALSKLGSSYYKQDYGALTWINYVPVVNVALGFGHYLADANAQLLAGYPDAKKRIVAIYKTLQIELDENKDLSPTQKSELRAQIDSLNNIYNEYVFDWSPKGFVYALFHKLTFKKLKNESSDVEKNVLEAMRELSEEQKFKEAKEGKKQTYNASGVTIKKSALFSAVLGVMKSLRSIGILKGFTKQMEPEFINNM